MQVAAVDGARGDLPDVVGREDREGEPRPVGRHPRSVNVAVEDQLEVGAVGIHREQRPDDLAQHVGLAGDLAEEDPAGRIRYAVGLVARLAHPVRRLPVHTLGAGPRGRGGLFGRRAHRR